MKAVDSFIYKLDAFTTARLDVFETPASPQLFLNLFFNMGDWLDEFGIRDTTTKILLGVAALFVGRFFLTLVEQEARDFHRGHGALHAPPSDSDFSGKTIPLSTRGNAGIYATLEHMAAFVRADAASQYLRQFVIDLVRHCHGHDSECEIRACFEFARDAIIYRRDPHSVERVSDARRTIESGFGDCDDKCVLLCSLLAVVGYRTRFIVCGFKRDSHSHVYCEVLTSRGWLALDPTPENAAMGWEQKHAPYREVFEIFR